MINLLEETKCDILQSGHTIANIKFIGSADGEYSCTWAEFEVLANIEYNAGYGGAEIASDLIIRFTDGRDMWRGEYDGSEWWNFTTPESQMWRAVSKPIRSLKGHFGGDVADIQKAFVVPTNA